MSCPMVTVVIPVYNRENTILRAINSVLQQTYKNIEVVVVDDGSTDATASIVKRCQDSRVHLICLPCNRGTNYARNRGIEKAKGEFIAFQDSDDEWLNDKLDRQMNYMQKKDIEASFSPYILYQGQQKSILPEDYQSEEMYEHSIAQRLKKGNVVGTPTLLVKKEVVFQIGMFNENMKRLQDYEFVIRLVKRFKLGYINQPLVKAYRMTQSISTDNEALIDAYANLIEMHADFVDLESILDILLVNHTFFEEGVINWKAFDRIIDSIKKSKYPEAEGQCYQRVMEYLYERYFPMKQMLMRWYDFFNCSIQTGKYAIYGAGAYGRKAFQEMKNRNCIPKYFLVTEQGAQQEIEGIPILPLSEHNDNHMPIIIAVSWKIQNELIENLLEKNIYNFCVYPFA